MISCLSTLAIRFFERLSEWERGNWEENGDDGVMRRRGSGRADWVYLFCFLSSPPFTFWYRWNGFWLRVFDDYALIIHWENIKDFAECDNGIWEKSKTAKTREKGRRRSKRKKGKGSMMAKTTRKEGKDYWETERKRKEQKRMRIENLERKEQRTRTIQIKKSRRKKRRYPYHFLPHLIPLPPFSVSSPLPPCLYTYLIPSSLSSSGPSIYTLFSTCIYTPLPLSTWDFRHIVLKRMSEGEMEEGVANGGWEIDGFD